MINTIIDTMTDTEADEIIRGEPLGPRVTCVLALEDFELLVTFNNGEQRVFDAKPLLKYPVFAPLRNVEFFKLVKATLGTIEWPSGIDYCPDTLYIRSRPVA